MNIERRTRERYPLELVVEYQTLDGQSVSGSGRTVNVSSRGALIAAEHNFAQGTRLKVTMEWPTLLDGVTPLQLVTTGIVVRHMKSSLGIAFDWYQFRTMRRGSSTFPKTALNAGQRSNGHYAKASAAAVALSKVG